MRKTKGHTRSLFSDKQPITDLKLGRGPLTHGLCHDHLHRPAWLGVTMTSLLADCLRPGTACMRVHEFLASFPFSFWLCTFPTPGRGPGSFPSFCVSLGAASCLCSFDPDAGLSWLLCYDTTPSPANNSLKFGGPGVIRRAWLVWQWRWRGARGDLLRSGYARLDVCMMRRYSRETSCNAQPVI